MTTQEILDRIISADKKATEAYENCLNTSKQAPVLAEKKLKAILADVQADANAQVAKLWQESREKIVAARENLSLDTDFKVKLQTARQRMDPVVDRLVSELLSSKSN